MKITKEELLEAAKAGHEHPNAKFHLTALESWEDGVVAGARTAGCEVVEEPELPERVAIDDFGCVYDGANAKALIATGDAWGVWLREAVLRYNAKAKVMKVAEELGRDSRFADDMDFARMERLLRAAYKEKP